ncbi:hypothetical protein NDU88_001038 [Pleurodeles waltl]|uniref:Uncharacterized protein n=1 Tax=Pleurodeles waltl TaxID=8319 RepID=A0AAV7U701_PLEWA|nr:hypothetical protein NDU88_001038 [Pleurodeles waltl]
MRPGPWRGRRQSEGPAVFELRLVQSTTYRTAGHTRDVNEAPRGLSKCESADCGGPGRTLMSQNEARFRDAIRDWGSGRETGREWSPKDMAAGTGALEDAIRDWGAKIDAGREFSLKEMPSETGTVEDVNRDCESERGPGRERILREVPPEAGSDAIRDW